MYGVRDIGAGELVRSRLAASSSLVPPRSIWSSEAVIARIERAARLVQFDKLELPSDQTVRQVDVIRTRFEAYGLEPARLSRVLASGREIDERDEVIHWMSWIETVDDRNLVWARALHVKWRHLERRLGMTERGLRKRHRRLILGLVLRLNS